MTGPRRGLLVLAVLGVLGVGAAGIWFVAAPGEHASPVAAAAPRPTDSTWPGLAAGPSAAAPVTPSAAAPAETSAPAAGAGGPAEPVAAPFVQNYAGQPGVKPLKPLPSPTGTHYVRPNVDGCDHNYGGITQCVPWTFPAGTTDKCAWLAGHGFKNLKVAATDRQRLDRDGNGIACDD
ncbi:hypothetical protein Ani05nite_24760 [Amorphoplanes nipponensis]|uniref:Excalibur calcium-binding domain-containing protein n=1 Tax=Actinoplanes nipponensis TaxID=135950 RepID=A0A919JH36_9ACTN|nr:hypothetical protein [Actinoplanes nipponensis]GIE48942.1 hypothetical protein Ani05nite_24760 [Actinoplanes nipponensis]